MRSFRAIPFAVSLVAFACGSTGSQSTTSSVQSQSNGGSETTETPHATEASQEDASFRMASIETTDAATATAIDAALITASDAATAPAETADFPVAPLRLVPTASARGEDARLDLELRRDGTIYAHGQFVGQLVGGRVLDAHGEEILAVHEDGTVYLDGHPTRVRMGARGEIALDASRTMVFDDDGTPRLTVAGQAPERGPSRAEGFTPTLRRTAGLLALLAAMVRLP